MSVQLYKDGNCMAIKTDCEDEDEFIDEFSVLLGAMIEDKEYEGDWMFQLTHWLPQVVDMCCAYRGYKTDVRKKQVLIAGFFDFKVPPNHEYDPVKQADSERQDVPL